MGVICSYCKSQAAYIDINQKRYCRKHFLSNFEKRVGTTIKRYKLLDKKERIAVACSGGKDSTTALYILNKLYKDVEAIAIDEGIKGYRKKTLDDLKRFCKMHGIKLNIYSFKKEFGFYLDKIKDKKSICMQCGVLRRYLLNQKAKGFDKLATGHNLDDEAQSILMNIYKSNIESLMRLGPISGVARDAKFVPRVKPLYLCTEKECLIYSCLMRFDVGYNECPHAGFSFRANVRDLLNEYEYKNLGSKQRLVENFLLVLPKIKKSYSRKTEIGYCDLCGEPSMAKVCNACSIVKSIKKQ